jgi:hypothetical protein
VLAEAQGVATLRMLGKSEMKKEVLIEKLSQEL